MENNNLIYAHRDNKTLEIYYIGKGSYKRAHATTERRSKAWFEYKKQNGDPIVEILKDGLTNEESLILEIQYIQLYGRRIDGTGNLINIKLGEEFPEKYMEEFTERMSILHKGKIVSKETRKKQSIARLARNSYTEKQKQTFRDSSTRKRAVIQLTKEGEFVRGFESMADAERFLNLPRASIRNVLNGRQKTTGGFCWKYK